MLFFEKIQKDTDRHVIEEEEKKTHRQAVLTSLFSFIFKRGGGEILLLLYFKEISFFSCIFASCVYVCVCKKEPVWPSFARLYMHDDELKNQQALKVIYYF